MDSELIRRKDVLAKVVGGGEFAFIPAEKIREIPAVDAVPVVHARWASKPNWTLDKCSNCGKNGFPEWPYCPGCGARMDADAPPRATDHFVDANKKDADAPERSEGSGNDG